ncbi:MAG: hydroxymethylpyrimidine/phosphomethylpyrimidine kinase [Candidatus Endobugula sp.]|jgi:hydroxymethylpyrimidine/phosphomethylpyrimidine kinase
MKFYYPSVLTIAGSDSGGGAGIQADIKTISALGCFASSALTAVTVQNTLGVTGIHSVPAEVVRDQIKAVMDDIEPSVIKIGMIHSKELAIVVAETLQQYPTVDVIFDPVMVAASGDVLIEDDTIIVLKECLFPLASVVTPNIDEATILSGLSIKNVDDMREAAHRILKTACKAVLLKGGHLQGNTLFDLYIDQSGKQLLFTSDAISTPNIHGAGCTLSAAIAAYRATGYAIEDAVQHAHGYVHDAIEHGKDVTTGKGNGPLNHFYNPKKLIKHKLK